MGRGPALAFCLGIVAGCGDRVARTARPLPSGEWKASLDPPPRRIPYLVTGFQSAGSEGVAVGSGSIVHSCPEHGTFVLTSYHCTNRPGAPRVWVYDFARRRPPADPPGLFCYRAERVYPQIDCAGGVMDEFLIAVKDLDQLWNRDFAVLKLRTRDLFHTAPLSAGAGSEPPPGSPVALEAVEPEGYPHSHTFRWGKAFPEEAFQHGHSGGPILQHGSLIALFSSSFADTTIVRQAPSISAVREVLHEAGGGSSSIPRPVAAPEPTPPPAPGSPSGTPLRAG